MPKKESSGSEHLFQCNPDLGLQMNHLPGFPVAPKVVVTDHNFDNLSVEEEVLAPLGCQMITRRCGAESDLIELVRQADCVITQFAPLTPPVIGAMEKVRAIVRYGIGVDNVNVEAAGRKRIPVCNVPDYCTDEVADHSLALILALTRQIPQICQRLKAGGPWNYVNLPRMAALKNLVIGVVGFGRIGREVVVRLNPFKCAVLVHDPLGKESDVAALGARLVPLQELLEASDVVTLHCPSTEKTRHLINRESLGLMKPGALLVNVARGSIVETAALVAALREGSVGGAGLDVTDPEPLTDTDPLLKMENVIVTNHVASCSPGAVRQLRVRVAEIAAMALKGQPLPNVVNASAFPQSL